MKNNDGWACLGIAVFLVITIILSSVLNGWVLSILWSWFIVPYFSLPKISIAIAIGISLIVAMLTHQESNKKEDKEETLTSIVITMLIKAIATPAIFLVFGWVVHLFL